LTRPRRPGVRSPPARRHPSARHRLVSLVTAAGHRGRSPRPVTAAGHRGRSPRPVSAATCQRALSDCLILRARALSTSESPFYEREPFQSSCFLSVFATHQHSFTQYTSGTRMVSPVSHCSRPCSELPRCRAPRPHLDDGPLRLPLRLARSYSGQRRSRSASSCRSGVLSLAFAGLLLSACGWGAVLARTCASPAGVELQRRATGVVGGLVPVRASATWILAEHDLLFRHGALQQIGEPRVNGLILVEVGPVWVPPAARRRGWARRRCDQSRHRCRGCRDAP
jgi:hypothetical protein